MAKYQLKNSNRKVDCELLTESENQYVVKFTNGIVQRVPKNRISNLDKIDEGVLDTIRNAGNRLSDRLKGAVQKVKEFFAKAFNIDGFVIFSSDDKILSASHPINAIEGALNCDSVNFTPSLDTIELCNEVGVTPQAVKNFKFSGGEYEGFGAIDCETNESVSDDVANEFMLSEGERLKDGEKITLEGDYYDLNDEQIVNLIANEYIDRYNGHKPNSNPLLIWGAPGIGKTAIVRSLKELVKSETGKEINILSVNGGNLGPDDFTMPASIARTLRSGDSEDMDSAGFRGGYSGDIIKDLPKTWLPVYDINDDNADKLRMIANGAKMNEKGEVTEDGPGGIFFIDEFSRMSPAGINALMQTPTSRNIGSNSTLTFGDRWVIICAANSKSDMARSLQSEALELEAATKTRFDHCNFVPNPENWIKWATSESKRRPGRKNILNEIVLYIEDEVNKGKASNSVGDFYEMYSHPRGTANGKKGTACPRTWEAFSEKLIAQCLENKFGVRYESVASIPKAKLIEMGAGILGQDVIERFADFMAKFSGFTPKDAQNVWAKGDNAQYNIIKKRMLNSANIEEMFNKQIFPLMKDNYPGGLPDAISPQAAMNFMKFLESCCYENGKFMLNRFKTISQNFSQLFNVDLRSLNGPYADVANYKEDVIHQNEIA